MARFIERFQRGRPGTGLAMLERAIIELLEPVVQRAATDLFVLTQGRPGRAGTKREFYEVTLVQHLYQYLLMSPALHEYDVRWEVPFGPGNQNPKRVDLVLDPPNAAPIARMLLEVGYFSVEKLKVDSEKLRDLQHGGTPVGGEKRVLLYWLGAEAPATAAAVRTAITTPMRNARSRTRIGPTQIKPLWVFGTELYAQTVGKPTQFSAVLVEVLP